MSAYKKTNNRRINQDRKKLPRYRPDSLARFSVVPLPALNTLLLVRLYVSHTLPEFARSLAADGIAKTLSPASRYWLLRNLVSGINLICTPLNCRGGCYVFRVLFVFIGAQEGCAVFFGCQIASAILVAPKFRFKY